MSSGKESPYYGSASITREQFLFYEMRTTAQLMCQGLDDEEIIKQIIDDNLFQYPTEKSLKRMAKACIARLRALDDDDLIEAMASGSSEVAKQICLYAMMKQYHLIWEFMVTVIGEKYRTQDFSFGPMDINVFFMRLQEQDDLVAEWSDSTIGKLHQILVRVLVENDYLDDKKSDHINPVLIEPVLENAIRSKGEERALIAFNCFV